MRLAPLLSSASLATFILAACGSDPTDAGSNNPQHGTPFFQRGVPVPWYGITTAHNAHESGLDLGVSRTGSAGYVRSVAANPVNAAFGAFAQEISAVGHRGKRLRLSGYVRADSVTGSGAGLWMRIDAPSRSAGFDNMIGSARPILGSSDWTRYSVVLDVPADAVGITFGLILSGGGVVRVDDLVLEEVDASVPTTGGPGPGPGPTDSVAVINHFDRAPHDPTNLDFEGMIPPFNLTSTWLRSVARPFTTDAPGSGVSDLAEIGVIVGDARVAGFGEATHGSREFFRMKHRALEYLVEERGYTHFLIEATMPEARAIDRYLATGLGDPARLLANLHFWTWNTREVLDLIQWMRTYNVNAGTARLRFFGFDMQYPHEALDSIAPMLGRVGTAAETQGRTAVECFDGARSPNGQLTTAQYLALTQARREQCAAALSALADTIRAHQGEWRGAVGAEAFDWLEQYVTLARQWEHMARATDPGEVFKRRDRAMADNVLWIAGREPAARLFVWAHNGHISRRPDTMGRHLATALGDQYRNVALTFSQGRFNAVTRLPDGTFGPLQVHTVAGAAQGSVESFMLSTVEGRLILATRHVLTGETGTFPLNRRPVWMRSVGSVYAPESPATHLERALLPQDYDGIIWFAGTSESRLLPF